MEYCGVFAEDIYLQQAILLNTDRLMVTI
jgi:hypothetical protein